MSSGVVAVEPADPPEAADESAVLLRHHWQVLEMLSSGQPLADILETIISGLEQLVPGVRCSILLVDGTRRVLRHGAAPGLPEGYVRAIDGIPVGPAVGSCGTAAYTNRPVITVDVQTDPRWERFRDEAAAAGLRSCWSTPIRGRDDKPVGTFAVYSGRPHRPSARERAAVAGFTRLAAVAIEHVKLVGDLVETEERFRRAFEDNAMGMLMVALDRRIERSNRAFAEMVGHRPSVAARLSLDEVLAADDVARVRLLMDGFIQGTIHKLTVEVHLVRVDGERVPVEATFSLLSDAAGDPAHLSVGFLDLTERRSTERERQARLESEVARRTAEEHSRAKSALLREVGHEVRTPIQTITGFAELMRTLDLDETRRKEALEGIGSAAGHVMDLLNDVLEISRIEAGALRLDVEDVDVATVAREVLDLLTPQILSGEIDVLNSVPPYVVRVDRRRLKQVLINVVGNAIRYGSVVELKARARKGCVYLTVGDDGPGIPAEILPRLFAPFEHYGTAACDASGCEAADSRSSLEGFGLGLALARGLAVAMGGDLRADSPARGGTLMTVILSRAVT